jgi:hypothetical protein
MINSANPSGEPGEAQGGQPNHVVKAVAGASGLDGGEVPGRSR